MDSVRMVLIHLVSRSFLSCMTILRLFGSREHRGRRLVSGGLHDHHGTMRPAHHRFGHAAEQEMFQPRAPMLPHYDEVTSQLLQDLQDVAGARPIGHNYLVLHADLGVCRLKVLEAIPEVCGTPLARTS